MKNQVLAALFSKIKKNKETFLAKQYQATSRILIIYKEISNLSNYTLYMKSFKIHVPLKIFYSVK